MRGLAVGHHLCQRIDERSGTASWLVYKTEAASEPDLRSFRGFLTVCMGESNEAQEHGFNTTTHLFC
jgi:hypothetical protein